MPFSFSSPASEDEILSQVSFTSLAFAAPEPGVREWLEKKATIANCRVLRDTVRGPVASLVLIPMGQFFGGKSVPMLGIAGVAVPPHERGKGYARELMRSCLHEAHESGVALSTLYASTASLYRSVGYQHAGYQYETRFNPKLMGACRGTRQEIFELKTDTDSAVSLYNSLARFSNGNLDRPNYIWDRIRNHHGSRFDGYGVKDTNGLLSGYVYLTQKQLDSGNQEIRLSDCLFADVDAGRALLGLLADFSTMAESITIRGGSPHPLALLLPLSSAQTKLYECWMTRIINLKSAIEHRGFASCVNSQFILDIRDDVLTANTGRWDVVVANGQGHCERTSGRRGPLVTCSIGGLAPIFTGMCTAREARQQGLIAGDDAAMAMIDGVFTGGAPTLPDFF